LDITILLFFVLPRAPKSEPAQMKHTIKRLNRQSGKKNAGFFREIQKRAFLSNPLLRGLKKTLEIQRKGW
jgi:hypothetical protein